MSRASSLGNPMLLGFEQMERMLDRAGGKSGGEGYPPYNIERLPDPEGRGERLRITLAVAGFTKDQLEVEVRDSQLTIRGRQEDDSSRIYLHRGIAARQFQRTFVLADGIEVAGAEIRNGLLSIELKRPEPDRTVRQIEISQND